MKLIAVVTTVASKKEARAMVQALVEARLAACVEEQLVERPPDIALALDLIFGPLFYRLLMGHAPITRGFVEQLIDAVIPARA